MVRVLVASVCGALLTGLVMFSCGAKSSCSEWSVRAHNWPVDPATGDPGKFTIPDGYEPFFVKNIPALDDYSLYVRRCLK
jgi:hypothetical protein